MKNGGIPHTALIYADRKDRNRLIESYLKQAKANWNSLGVLSAQPGADTEWLRRTIRRNGKGRREKPLSVVDVRECLAKGRSTGDSILSLLRNALHAGPEAEPTIIIGDWTCKAYDRFHVVLEVEEAEEDTVNLICCFRGEGFWSLPTKQIAQTFELHRRVLFCSTIFGKETEI